MNNNHKIKISLFNSLSDTKPKAKSCTWGGLCKTFNTPKIRAIKTDAQPGSLYSSAIFEGTRKKDNVTEISLLSLDYDSGIDIETALSVWKELGIEFFWHTTYSHTEAHPKFRVVIPLNKPILPDKYLNLWKLVEGRSGKQIDAKTKDASRMFYMPACSEDTKHLFRAERIEGKLLDWEEILSKSNHPVSTNDDNEIDPWGGIDTDDNVKSKKTKSKKQADTPVKTNGQYSAYVENTLNKAIAKVENAATGERNDTLYKAAVHLKKLLNSSWSKNYLTEQGITYQLSQAAYKADLDKDEIERTINSAFNVTEVLPHPNKTELAEFTKPQSFEDLEPQPLGRELEKSEQYPVDALGNVLQDAVHDIIKQVQCPAAIAAQSILAGSALAVQGITNVETLIGNKPISLFMITIGDSGERKSTTDGIALTPHTAFIYQDNKRYHQEKRQADKDTIIKPARRLRCSDATVQGLSKIFIFDPAIGLFSDEGGQVLGGYSMKENHLHSISSFCKLWDGDGIDYTRTTEQFRLYNRRFSLHLMIQPSIWDGVIRNTMNSSQGFLSRCLITYPESNIGTRFIKHNGHTQKTWPGLEKYSEQTKALLLLQNINADTRELELRPVLFLSSEARHVLIDFYNQVEADMAANGKLSYVRNLVNKSAENACRLAGILALMDNIDADKIDVDTMKNAIRLTQYYNNEALRLADGSRDADLDRAAKLLDWLYSRGKSEVTATEIYQYSPKPLQVRQKAEALKIMEILEDYQWVWKDTKGRSISWKIVAKQ